ncbi:hypothetical protein CVT26_004137 [Gymnopilus dilepis]|uniref:Uncharacterized protein n=1 Tax=Gymnopilus dilepis TaxID=231916 RepID=A0A409YVF9_9AGAR|nr:hypothetical protein CVT26_004137 [Gymnopilus dilepis]
MWSRSSATRALSPSSPADEEAPIQTVEASTLVKELESLMDIYRDLNPSSQLETDMQRLLDATECTHRPAVPPLDTYAPPQTNEASLSVAELMSLFEATVADAGLKEYFDAPSQPFGDIQRLMDVFSQPTPGSSSSPSSSFPQFWPDDMNVASLLDGGFLAKGLPVAQGQVQDTHSSGSRTNRDHYPPQSSKEATPIKVLEQLEMLAAEQEKTKEPQNPIPVDPRATARDALSELAGIQQELAHFRASFREIIKSELGVVLQEDNKSAKNALPVEARGHKEVEGGWRMTDRKSKVDEARMEVAPAKQANKRVRSAASDNDEMIPHGHSGRSSNPEVEAADSEERAQKRRRLVAPSFDMSSPGFSSKGKGSTAHKPPPQAHWHEASSSKAGSADTAASGSSSFVVPSANVGPAYHPGERNAPSEYGGLRLYRREMG